MHTGSGADCVNVSTDRNPIPDDLMMRKDDAYGFLISNGKAEKRLTSLNRFCTESGWRGYGSQEPGMKAHLFRYGGFPLITGVLISFKWNPASLGSCQWPQGLRSSIIPALF